MIANFPLISFLALVVGFGFLVFVHELGHFLVAKWVGIKVTQFAIGFGPSIVAWRKGVGFRTGSTEAEYEKRLAGGADAASMGETEYRLNYLPLGGYVKMLGQDDLDPTASSNDPRSFNTKPIWARACVISAGVVMNLIVGVIFFIIAFMSGVMFPPAIVGGTLPNYPAATTYAVGHDGDLAYQGLQVGDRVTHLNGDPIKDMLDIRVATALGRAGEPLKLTVRRTGVSEPLNFVMTPQPGPEDGMLTLGIAPPLSATITGVAPGSDVAKAGVESGMEIVAVDGAPIDGFGPFYQAIKAAQGQPVSVTFEDKKAGKRVDVSLAAAPGLVQADDQPAQLAGFVPAVVVRQVAKDSPAEAGGILAGDLIASLGGAAWPSFTRLFELIQEADNEPIAVSVLREGRLIDLGTIAPKNGLIGIVPARELSVPGVGSTLPGSPAAALNLAGGSHLLEIAGQPVESWADMQRVLAAVEPTQDGSAAVDVTYRLNIAGSPEAQEQLKIPAAELSLIADAAWIPPQTLGFGLLRERVIGENPIEATKLGIEKTGQFMAQTYIALLRLFQGSVKVKNLRGPVGIVDEGTKIAQEGWEYLLFFLGLISVNLVVINFLPIPIVDGGLMVFLLIEKIKGSPVSTRVLELANYVGLALIGFVFLATLYYDVSRLIGS